MLNLVTSRIDLNQAFSRIPTPLDFVLPGFLSGTVGALVAPGSTGKSFWALEASMAIASGSCHQDADLLNVQVKGGRVVMMSLEDPRQIIENRVHSIGKFLHQNAQGTISENLDVLDLFGKKMDLMDVGTVSSITEYCKGARLIVIDTLSRAHRLNENDNGEMAQLMGQMDSIAKNTGSSVLFLHHIGKSAAMNGLGSQQQASRGASVLVDNARWVGFLQKMTTVEAKEFGIDKDERWRYVKFGVSKINYGEAVPERWLERHDGGVLKILDLQEVEKVEEKKPVLKVVQNGDGKTGAWDDIDF